MLYFVNPIRSRVRSNPRAHPLLGNGRLRTVDKDENQEGHAVLTLKTSKGEFVLDNLNDEMKPWTTTGYRFVKRQSQEDPNIWVMLGPPVEAPLYTAR